MKHFLLIFLGFSFLVSCKQEGYNAKTTTNSGNPEVAALDSIHRNFLTLSQKVDSISANLSEIEKQRAAFFLLSAYNLVIQSYVERGNPAEPYFTQWMESPRKFGGDNPYTIYSQVAVNPEFAYKLSVKKGSSIYFGVQMYGNAQGFNLPTSNIGMDKIKFEPDGSFVIYISKQKPEKAKNWIALSDTDHAFIVRQYFDKRVNNIPENMKIERIDNSLNQGISYLNRLRNANKMLTDYILGTIDICYLLKESAFNKYSAKDNQVRSPKYGGALYPTKDNKYEGCWLSLKPGQAMRVHGHLPKNTLYASYVFYDRWYNTPNYPKTNCFRTKEEIVLNKDGSFDLYISPEKINHPNWIDTGGLYEGSYSSRYLQSTETSFPEVEIVNIKDIIL